MSGKRLAATIAGGVLLVIVVAAIALRPWKWGKAGVEDDLAVALTEDGELATLACGADSPGLRDVKVSVTDITYGAQPNMVTAQVSGMDGAKRCSATLTMEWAMAARQSGQTKDSVAVFRHPRRTDAK